jgi:acetylornithine deacetylase
MTTLELLEQMVRINSVNPNLEANAPGETQIAALVRDWCKSRSLETQWIEPVKGRPSVIAVARGRGGGRSLMLNAHLDTVGVAGMTDPFTPRIENGFLFGRGACDMKASLAVCLKTLERARGLHLSGDVILTAVSDEEHGGIGTESVLEVCATDFGTIDAAILTEPTGLQVCVAHRGFAVFEIEITGRASHSSQPELGVNAINGLGWVLLEIEALNQNLEQREAHPLLGHGHAQATMVAGGSALFTTPSSARVSLERRTLPGETRDLIETEVRDMLERIRRAHPQFEASWKTSLHREPFNVDEQTPILQTVTRALKTHNLKPNVTGAPYWMDSALIAAKGIPTVILGPTAHDLHGTNERVDLSEVPTLEQVLLSVIQDFCA